MKKVIVLILLAAWLAPFPAFAEDTLKGKYEVIGDLSKLKNAKQIEMVEFFNYSCGHCYRFLETAKRLHKKYKGKLFHKKQPIYWGKQTPYPAMAYFISDEQAVEEKFTQSLFDTFHLMKIDIFQPRVIKMLSKDMGIENEMTAGMQSPKIKAKVDKSLELAKKIDLKETPTVIINGVLRVTPSISGGSVDKMTDNLEVIFDDILKQ